MSEPSVSIEDLNQWLLAHHLHGYWMRGEGGEGEGFGVEAKPWLWKWPDIYTGLLKAGELVPVGPKGLTEMRTVGLQNPQGKGLRQTISLGPQILMPGERTRAHRNLKNETRFVVKAPPGAVFIAENEAFPMEEGDLIVSPTWTNHDHYNGGTEPAIWLDGLDMGLVSLGTEINERFPEDQPYQGISKPDGYALNTLGHLRPTWTKHEYARPPAHYPWKETYVTLMALKESEAEGDPCDGIHLGYTSPVDGGPTLPTFSCEISLLLPKLRTQAHRHNSTTIYHAFRGQGVTVVADERLEWSQGDIFFVPPWTWHYHENPSTQDAIVYSIDDWPAMTKLGFYRKEDTRQ